MGELLGTGCRVGLCAALWLAASPAAEAFTWNLDGRIRASETYTDNVNLDPEGEEEYDLVTEIAPGIDLTGTGPRTRVNLSYTLQGLYEARDDDVRIFNSLNGSANSELVPNTLFFDARANRRQGIDDLFGPIGVDNITDTGNIQGVTTVSAGPTLVNRLGSFATSTLGYTHERVFFDDGENSRADAARWDLASGSLFGRLGWGIGADYRRNVGTDDDTATFASANARASYQLSAHWRVSATGGYENNDFESDRGSIDGGFWQVALRWAPTRRTSLEGGYGRRFFGETWFANISHRRRFTVFTASYAEDIDSSLTTALVEDQRIPVFDPGCPPTDPACDSVGEVVLFRTDQVQGFFVQRRATAALTFTGQRHSLTLAGFWRERDFELTDEADRSTGATASYTVSSIRAARVNFGAGWSRNESDEDDREDDTYSASVTLDRNFANDLTGGIRARHQRRDSNEANEDFRENSVTVFVTARF